MLLPLVSSIHATQHDIRTVASIYSLGVYLLVYILLASSICNMVKGPGQIARTRSPDVSM